MKRATILCSIGSDENCAEIYEQFKNDIPKEFSKYQYKRGSLALPLEPESPALECAIEVAHKKNAHVKLFSKVYYTNNELDQVPFFQMEVSYPLELDGTYASDFGTKYEGGCQRCGLGSKPIGNVLVDRKFVRKYDIGVLCPDIYVTERVRGIIESGKLTGVSFNNEVKDYKGREMPFRLFVINIHHILLPMATSTWLCPDGFSESCGHDVIYLHSDIQYERNILVDALDFNLSMEYINNYRLQEIIVSSKVRKVFKDNKINAHFIPVTIL